MGLFYDEGEVKVRAGVYRRYDTTSSEDVNAIDGIGAIMIQADSGPLGEVVEFSSKDISSDLESTYGTNGTVNIAQSFANGGLDTLYVYRMGTGGACASLTIDDSDGGSAGTISAKYPGVSTLSIVIKENLTTGYMELYVYNNTTTLKSKVTFDGSNQSLSDALSGNSYITYEMDEGTETSVIAELNQTELSGGENPTVTNDDYQSAFDALEPYTYNVIALDTVDSDVQELLYNYMLTAYENGKLSIAVIGDTVSDSSEDAIKALMENAKAYDSELIVYASGTFYDSSSNHIEGAEAIARYAGVIAATSSNRSILHTEIPGAASIGEIYTNDIYEAAIESGLLLISEGMGGEVWFDSQVNTLINLSENQDKGWKKIKRTKVRMELFDRLDRVLEPVIGKVNCDDDGIAYVIQRALTVIDAMASESKIKAGGTFEVASEGYAADYAYFDISVVDIDTLEKIYLHYTFSYTGQD